MLCRHRYRGLRNQTLLILLLTGVGACFGCRKQVSTSTDEPQPTARENKFVASDLVQRSASASSLFESLDSKTCGIDFLPKWKPRDNSESLLLKTGFTGGGVAMGDYDADGLVDLFFTRPHGGGKLFRNVGDFKFEDVTETARVSFPDDWHTGATFTDFNNDGRLDLAIGCLNSSNRLLQNKGDGTFKDIASSCGLDFAGATIKKLFADYDNDGDLDVYVVTNRLEPKHPVKIRYTGKKGSYGVAEEHKELAMVINLPSGEQKFAKAGQFDRLYRNDLQDGIAKFVDVTKEAGITGNFHGLDGCWWDADLDGDADLYVTNDFTDPDQFFRNNGDGTFTEISKDALPCTPWFAMGCDVGDLNNDCMLDLLAADMAGSTHYREKMSMGSMDAVAWFLDTAEPRQFMRNALFINTGTPRFVEAAHLAGLAKSDWTWSVKIADFDNDGREDVFFTNGFTRDYLNSDFNNKLQQQSKGRNSLAWYDAPRLDEQNLAFRNEGNLSFRDASKGWGLDHVGISFGAAVGDLDNDGDLDLVVNNFEAQPSIYRNTVNTNNRVTIRLSGERSNRVAFGATVELMSASGKQIRYAQPSGGFLSCDDTTLHFGLGADEKIESLEVTWPAGGKQTLRDLPANQLLAIREPTPGKLDSPANDSSEQSAPLFRETQVLADVSHQEKPFDDFALQPLLPNRLSQLGPGIAAGDINGDGLVDLFCGGSSGDVGKLLVQASSGSFEPRSPECFETNRDSEDMGCLFFDADVDGDLDLYVVSGGVERPPNSPHYADRLYLNESTKQHVRFRLAREALPKVSSSGGPVAAGDFDHDGDLDLFVGGRVLPGQYPLASESLLLRNDSGQFQRVEMEPFADIGMVTGCLWTDFNNDDWLDLVVTTDYGPIRVFRNNKGELSDVSKELGTAALLGWWNSITGADLDLDGDIDYIVGNLGRNTKYHPSVEKPQHLFYGAFETGGRSSIVEAKSGKANSGEECLLPVRGRSCSSHAMPFIAEKFETYHAFATASLSDIYSDDSLNKAQRTTATLADTGVLINQQKPNGDRVFEFRPLPVEAQFAPVFGIEALHANDDAFPDLFLAQNFFTPQRETGRMNGGVSCLLLGDGSGNFEALAPHQSGIVIPDDAKGTVVTEVDGDGRLDLIVATNNGPIRTFALQTNATSVNRKGPRGKAESYWGSGYLSGGTAPCRVKAQSAVDRRPGD